MQDVFVGNYSENGINKMQFIDKQLKQTFKIGNFKNNSYICKYKNYLYSAIEIGASENVNSGEVAVFELNQKEPKLINKTISYGESPCFLIVDPTREILYVANYTGGSFVAFKIKEEGSIGEKLYLQKFGIKSRIHHIQFSKDYKSVFIIDLGEDCIIEYNIDYNQKDLKLIEKSKFYFPEKSEPRHMVIDKKENIYIVTEKSCELYKLNYDGWISVSTRAGKIIFSDCAGNAEHHNSFGYFVHQALISNRILEPHQYQHQLIELFYFVC